MIDKNPGINIIPSAKTQKSKGPNWDFFLNRWSYRTMSLYHENKNKNWINKQAISIVAFLFEARLKHLLSLNTCGDFLVILKALNEALNSLR